MVYNFDHEKKRKEKTWVGKFKSILSYRCR